MATRTTKKKTETEPTPVAVKETPKGNTKMGAIRVDFTGSDNAVKPLEAGEYQAKVISATLSDKAGQSGYHSIVLDWQVQDPKRKVRFHYLSLSPQALWKLKGVMTTLGMDIPEGEFDVDLRDFLDREATVVLKVEEYNGRENNKVEEVKAADPFAS